MNDKRASMIINYIIDNHQCDRKYILNIKFIVQSDTNNWIIRGKCYPVLHNEKAAILIRGSKLGMFTSIDKLYFERSYPVTDAIYGIYPLEKPNIDKLRR